MTKTEMAHIWLDEKGTAWIDDTSVKVIEVILWHPDYGWSPAEIHFQFPHPLKVTIGKCIEDLNFSAAVGETEDFANQIIFSPLK